MQTIFKFPIKIEEEFKIMLPMGAEVLTVQSQHDAPQMWVLLDSEKPFDRENIFFIATTGNPLPWARHAIQPKYIGTYQLASGSFVGHLFQWV